MYPFIRGKGAECVAAAPGLATHDGPISTSDPEGVFDHGSTSDPGGVIDLGAVQELVAAKLPKVHAKMEAMHCDMTIVATDWFICLFATVLPSEVCTPWEPACTASACVHPGNSMAGL